MQAWPQSKMKDIGLLPGIGAAMFAGLIVLLFTNRYR